MLAQSAIRPMMISAAKNTITLEFGRDDFLNSNGDIVNYTIIVAEEPIGNLSAHLLSWKDVQGFQTWPPYQVEQRIFIFASQVAHLIYFNFRHLKISILFLIPTISLPCRVPCLILIRCKLSLVVIRTATHQEKNTAMDR